MTAYTRRRETVEAWQVGNDEPMPEWAIGTMAIFSYSEGGWLVLRPGKRRFPEHMSDYEFRATYQKEESDDLC